MQERRPEFEPPRTNMKAGCAVRCLQSQCTPMGRQKVKIGQSLEASRTDSLAYTVANNRNLSQTRSGQTWEAVLWSPCVCIVIDTQLHSFPCIHAHTYPCDANTHTHCIHTNILNVTCISLEIDNFITEESYMGANEMVPQAKGLATMPSNLSLIPGTHKLERTNSRILSSNL